MTANWHLAEIDVGTLKGPQGSPGMDDFFESLDPVNAIADAAPGFVWRLQSEGAPGATGVRASIDPLLLINLSVWSDAKSLRDFVFGHSHAAILKQRRRWMKPFAGAQLALWWIPAGTLPTVNDGLSRLWHLDRYGPSAAAFTFKAIFPAPGTGSPGG